MGCCSGGEKRNENGAVVEEKMIEKSDGSLLFKKIPNPRVGFEHDEQNLKRLILVKVDCVHRFVLPMLQKNHQQVVTRLCKKQKWMLITDETCASCPLRKPYEEKRRSMLPKV
jgi:hypothetical protein